MKTIMIADNDRGVRENLLRRFREKYHVLFAASLDQAKGQQEHSQPDVLIIDNLEDGGVAFGDEIHERRKRGESKTAVIITSARFKSRTDTPQIQKSSPTFYDDLVAKVAEILGE